MRLTKLQRHTAYIIMLAEYEKGVGELCENGFCWMIKELFMDQGEGYDWWEDNVLWQNNVRYFKELNAKKPKKVKPCGSWFYCDDLGRKRRIEILKQCIKDTY